MQFLRNSCESVRNCCQRFNPITLTHSRKYYGAKLATAICVAGLATFVQYRDSPTYIEKKCSDLFQGIVANSTTCFVEDDRFSTLMHQMTPWYTALFGCWAGEYALDRLIPSTNCKKAAIKSFCVYLATFGLSYGLSGSFNAVPFICLYRFFNVFATGLINKEYLYHPHFIELIREEERQQRLQLQQAQPLQQAIDLELAGQEGFPPEGLPHEEVPQDEVQQEEVSQERVQLEGISQEGVLNETLLSMPLNSG